MQIDKPTEEEVTERKVSISYFNHRGHRGRRNIVPGYVWFGSTEYHTEQQWFLKAWDIDKNAERDFAMNDILVWG